MPFLSIITVCYNSAETIEATLQSVLNQGAADYEYIIVDGGSTDGTLALLEKWQPLFGGRMRYQSEPDHGIYDAMNKGIARSCGQWIGIINSDDAYLPGCFECVANCARKAGQTADVIYSDMDYVDGSGQTVRTVTGDANKLWKGMFVNHPTCFVSRSCYERCGCFDTSWRIVADYELMLRIRKKDGKFVKAPQKLALFHTGGVSDHSFESEMEKHRVQKHYFSPLLASYCYLRSLYAFKIRPLLRKGASI